MSAEDSAAPLSVTQLTARIKQMLEQGFAHVEVSGEVSRLTRPASGHLYFTIKDAHAAISAVIWRSAALRLSTPPEEGGEFIFSGHLSVYEPRGSYQLIVTRVEVAGEGKLAAEFERRKKLFAERGWFDPAHKHVPPSLPTHVGIVTSPTAAAFEDVKKVLATRPAWLQISLSPCLVQGSAAAPTIAAAITRLAAMDSPPDLILLVRGGGSIEDLWCFNDEEVVRAVVECPIPVISGVGHEIDTTLVDFAADIRAATPSNAAELCCPARDELRERLPKLTTLASLLSQQLKRLQRDFQSLRRSAHSAWQRGMDARHHAGERSASRLQHAASSCLHRLRIPLRKSEKRLAPLEPGTRVQQQRRDWSTSGIHLRQSFVDGIRREQRELERHLGNLKRAEYRMAQKRHRFELLAGKLAELDPAGVLRRGYSMSFAADGSLVTSVRKVTAGERLHVLFHDGSADTEVKSVTVEKA